MSASRSPSSSSSPSLASLKASGACLGLCLLLLLLWDASGADMALARWAGTPTGFPHRADFVLAVLMHEGGKTLSWTLVLGLLLAVRWPVGVLRRLTRAQRWQLALVPLIAVGVVTLLKQQSATSCPWDLQAFGGTAPWVSHWAWGLRDGGGGHCFPAGHASSAFGFVGGYFVLRHASRHAAALWLAGALLAGLALGLGQQWRGAHFMSHTLWSAWVCATVGLGVEAGVQAARRARAHTRAQAGRNAASMPVTSAPATAKLNQS